MKKILWIAAMLLLTRAQATPTRALTLDNQNQIIADDYDAIVYYHLMPKVLGSQRAVFYLDSLQGGKNVGWVFADTGYGDVALWWNRPYDPKFLFDLAGSSALLGQTSGPLPLTGSAGAGHENWIQAPDMKIAGGYALQFSDQLSTGVCLQYAELTQDDKLGSSDGAATAQFIAGSPASLNRYLSNAAYYGSNLKLTGYQNRQQSSGLVIAPLLGYSSLHFTLDAKLDLIFNRLANSHQEALRDIVGPGATMTGTLTQSLKDTGTMSVAAKAKLRYMLGDGSVVLRGSYGAYDFSTEHHQLGVFSGSGFSASELAGFDHVDASQTLKVTNYDAMLGWVQSFDKGRMLLIFGAGLNGSTTHSEDLLYTPKTGGSLNSLVKSGRSDTTTDTFAVPVVLGGEVELAHWCRARGVLQRNAWGSSKTSTQSQSFVANTNTVALQSDSLSYSDLIDQWTSGAGFGFSLGSIVIDMALNTGFLASSGALVNPAYQSTISWGF